MDPELKYELEIIERLLKQIAYGISGETDEITKVLHEICEEEEKEKKRLSEESEKKWRKVANLLKESNKDIADAIGVFYPERSERKPGTVPVRRLGGNVEKLGDVEPKVPGKGKDGRPNETK